MKNILPLIIFLAGLLTSCKKDFLDKKPNQALLIPISLSEFQSLLDNTSVMNTSPSLNLISSDDISTTDAGWSAYRQPVERNCYLWKYNPYEDASITDWNAPYAQIFYSNVVLDGLMKIVQDNSNKGQFEQVKGSALFYRAFALYNLTQQFAEPYNINTSKSALGIPVRLSSDVNEKSVRGTLQNTYDRILEDLLLASELLPKQTNIKSRPSKIAAFSLLARIYLSMNDYENARNFAGECLNIYNKVIDFNTLSASSTAPFPVTLPNGNDEIIFYNYPISYSFVGSTLTSIDPLLFQSYNDNDLRKTIFFRDRGNGIRTFKGYFLGLATSEIILIRAECNARLGDFDKAMDDLNQLMINRWNNKVAYPKFSATNMSEALVQILAERRKELVFRGIRWSDLRRLNQDTRFSVILKRKINGTDYELLPNSRKYVLPIPDNEVMNSGIQQNSY